MASGRGTFNAAALVIGALFKYLHFSQLAFYCFNVLMSSLTVVMFFCLARSFLTRKPSLYVTAVFAFNPELAFYNNFVLKENMVIFVMVVAMYFFFRAMATNCPVCKILFCLLLVPIALLREPLALIGILVIGLLPKRAIPWAGVAALGLVCMVYGQCAQLAKSYCVSHLGNYGITRHLLEDIYGVPTVITFGELFSSPALLAEYLIRSFVYYVRPGWNSGLKFNTFLVPYTLFVVYIFVASFSYRKYLPPAHRRAYLFVSVIIILLSLLYIIYDPVERYRYSVYQLGFTLLALNLYGYHEYRSRRPDAVTAELGAACEGPPSLTASQD